MRRNYFLVVMALAMMAISCTKETSVENGNGANAGNGGGTGGGGTGGGTGNGLLYKTVTVTSASGSANETMTTLFYYDAQSRLAADSTYGKSGGMDVTIYRKIYRDAQGRIVKIAQKMTQTGIPMDTSYTTAYYPNSTTLQPTYTIAEVSLMGFTTTDSSVFKYNGVKVASIESYMGSNILGPPTDTSSKWVFTYDAQDYLVNQKNYSDLSTTGNGVMQYVANYDFTYNTTFDDPAFDHNYNEFYKNQATSSKGAAMAAQKGILVTNSAGNEGGSSWNYLGFPADPDSVCAVGAVNASGAVAGFSSYGYPGKIKPNIASVGWNTYVAGPGNSFGYGSGTSYANPNINGLITCLWQAFPEYNNMKILDAVYKSCPTYTTPDNRIGYGIPNMKTAYRLLKKEQNTTLYGSEWLWATPNPFTTQIDVQLIGQIDGDATIKLLNSNNTVVATLTLTTELEEIYRPTLNALGNLPAGTYTLTYTDANKTRTITLSKTGVMAKDWLIAYPVPFQSQLTAYLTAPETGKASVRLLSMSGQLLETLSLDITQNTTYTLQFSKAASLAAGIYQVQYISYTQKKTVSVVKRNP